jgi:hypothetical protein
MNGHTRTPPGAGLADSRWWLLPLAGLLLAHGWLTARLASPGSPWLIAFDGDPVVSGRHALHLYHGYLGARAFRHNAQTVAVDPSYYAGYPKTPWFDAGSKPAEVVLWLGGGQFRPTSYRMGLVLTWALVPLVVFVAARALGLFRGPALLAALFGAVLCWEDFGRELLRAGDWHVVLAGALSVWMIGLLCACHAEPDSWHWLGLAGSLWGLTFVSPLFLILVAPVLLAFYVATGWKHRWPWHFGLLAAVAVAVAGNWPWLNDLVRFWWTQGASLAEAGGDRAPAWRVVWPATWPEDGLQQATGLGLVLLGLPGLAALRHSARGGSAAAVSVACATVLGLAAFGPAWEPVRGLDPERLLFAGLLHTAVPASQAVMATFAWAATWTGSALRGRAIVWAILLTGALLGSRQLMSLGEALVRDQPLEVGLPTAAEQTFTALERHTTADARVLFEERAASDSWSPLLAIYTRRSYIGGLGPEATLEHAASRLREGRLAGRPAGDWADHELADYCRCYNVGWVACWSGEARARLGTWAAARPVADLPGGGRLFEVKRPASYFLTGRGRVLDVDGRMLTLADLEPVDGRVVLTFHYLPGIVPSSDRVRVEREPQLYDPIPFIRLRLPGPVARLTLYWQE